MAGKKYYSRSQKRKRKCNVWEDSNKASTHSASMKKMTLADYLESDFSGYRLLDLELLFRRIEENVSCKECGRAVKFSESEAKVLGSKITMTCID